MLQRVSTQLEPTWRLLDSGLRRAAENIAFNKALLESHQEGHSPNTLRFLRFTPSALVGFHQDIAQELKVEYCREHDIEIQRRITGGGAIFFDPSQIGWELYLDKRAVGTADMDAIARRICEAAARGISALGVDARFRPRNDIEVDGRKISGTGGASDGDSILYQGTLLIEFDIERMLRVLRIPAEKLSDKAIATARERVVNLKELLGVAPAMDDVKRSIAGAFAQEFGVSFAESDRLGDAERERYEAALAEVDRQEWVYQHDRPESSAPILEGIYRSAGGLMRAAVVLDEPRQRLKQVWITGDFFVNPRRMVIDLEAALRNTALTDLDRTVGQFFATYPVEMLMLGREDFVAVIRQALSGQVPQAAAGGAAG